LIKKGAGDKRYFRRYGIFGVEIYYYQQQAQEDDVQNAYNKIEDDKLTKLYLFPAI